MHHHVPPRAFWEVGLANLRMPVAVLEHKYVVKWYTFDDIFTVLA